MKNVFQAIQAEGNDENFSPFDCADFPATNAMVGSQERIAVMVWRAEHGLPLWHPDDGPHDDSYEPTNSQRA